MSDASYRRKAEGAQLAQLRSSRKAKARVHRCSHVSSLRNVHRHANAKPPLRRFASRLCRMHHAVCLAIQHANAMHPVFLTLLRVASHRAACNTDTLTQCLSSSISSPSASLRITLATESLQFHCAWVERVFRDSPEGEETGFERSDGMRCLSRLHCHSEHRYPLRGLDDFP